MWAQGDKKTDGRRTHPSLAVEVYDLPNINTEMLNSWKNGMVRGRQPGNDLSQPEKRKVRYG
jgi:hypothetical protein